MPPLDPRSTQHLVRQAASHDPQAIEQLVVDNLPRLRQWLRCRMGPILQAHESAADLAQSVARDVLEELKAFEWRGEAAFRHWLFVHAEHKLHDRVRRLQAAKRDTRRLVAGEGDLASVRSPDASPSQHVIGSEAERQIAAAFDLLTADQREALSLFRFCGLSQVEIAARMSRSEAAVRNLIYRAVAVVSSAIASPGHRAAVERAERLPDC
jgi:RNA polymerase sigma-70 factor, ECF subfamily